MINKATIIKAIACLFVQSSNRSNQQTTNVARRRNTLVKTYQPTTERYCSFKCSAAMISGLNQLSFKLDMPRAALIRLGIRRLVHDYNEGKHVHPGGIIPAVDAE